MILSNKKLIEDLIARKLSKEEFLAKFPVNLTKQSDLILDSLESSLNKKDSQLLDYTLPLIIFDSEFKSSEKYVNVLCRLLLQAWHFRHEDIVALLQGIKSPNSTEVLYKTALVNFDYLDYDDTYSLARKCIHALGDINTEEAKEKLKLLAQSNIPIIKEKAEKQLYYYKR